MEVARRRVSGLSSQVAGSPLLANSAACDLEVHFANRELQVIESRRALPCEYCHTGKTPLTLLVWRHFAVIVGCISAVSAAKTQHHVAGYTEEVPVPIKVYGRSLS